MRRVLLTLTVALAAFTASSASAAGDGLQLTPVGRLPFPDRGYVVDLPAGSVAGTGAVTVRENGRLVKDLQVTPIGASGIHFGVVVAVDASASMRGKPLLAAVGAAEAFLANRQEDEEVGIVTFNGSVNVLSKPTSDADRLQRALL